MSVCPIDEFKKLVASMDALAEYSTASETSVVLAGIAEGVKKLKLMYENIYQLETCNQVCPHDINFCHCPREARDIKTIERKLKADNNELR